MVAFPTAQAVIERAIHERVFPGAVIEVGTTAGAVSQAAFGKLTYEAAATASSVETVYDLASLTKVVCTTAIAMRLVESGRLRLSDRLVQWLPQWRGPQRDAVTVRHLLAHSAGLAAWAPLFRTWSGRDEIQSAICRLPLDYSPGSAAVYSDLGFILLGFVLAEAGGAALDVQFESVLETVWRGSDPGATHRPAEPGRPSAHYVGFLPPTAWRGWIAPTELDSWRGRLLVGEVHDENCWALGGVAGHAGLFGTAAGVGLVARALLAARLGRDVPLVRHDTVRAFMTRQPEPGSTRALGWDTMLPTSSCGTRMSAAAVGHTGFTGTSLWLDPRADLYVVLLSNRVHPSREGAGINHVRPAVHDAIVAEFPAA